MEDVYIADLLLRRFGHRTDDYAVQVPDGGYRPTGQELTEEALLRHVAGRWCIGVYVVRGETVRFLCLDVDGKGKDAEFAREGVSALLATCRKFGLLPLVEKSGGKGWHLWIFTEEVEAALVRAVGAGLVKESGAADIPGVSGVEIFPKQPSVTGNAPFGNLVKLPFGKRKDNGAAIELVDGETLERVSREQQVELLENATAYTTVELQELVDGHGWEVEQKKSAVSIVKSASSLPCFSAILENGVDEGHRDNIAYRLAVICKRQGMPEAATLATVQMWDGQKVRPPLGQDQVVLKVRSAFRGGSTIGCESIQAARLCPALEGEHCPIYGKRQEEDEAIEKAFQDTGQSLSIEPLRIITSRPKTYEATVNGQVIRLEFEELQKFSLFKGVVMDRLNFIPELPTVRDHEGKKIATQTIWERQYVNPALASVTEYIETPPDASMPGIIWDHLIGFFKSKKTTDKVLEDLHDGALVLEEGVYRFKGKALRDYLATRANDVKDLNRSLFPTFREHGGGQENTRTTRGQVWVWRISQEDVEK